MAAPHAYIELCRRDYYVRLDAYLAEGGQEKDLSGLTRGQVIADVFTEYERLALPASVDQTGSVQATPSAVSGPGRR